MTSTHTIQAILPRINRIKQRLANQMPDLRLVGSNEEEHEIRDEVMAIMWLGAMQETKDETKADQFIELSLLFQSLVLTVGVIDGGEQIIQQH